MAEPSTREEKYLAKAAGEDVDISNMPEPSTRIEKYLKTIAENGGGSVDPEDIAEIVTDWLDDHVDPETGYVIDNTLLVEGAAADAKKVGDELTDVKSAFNDEVDFTPVELTMIEKKYLNGSTGAITDTTSDAAFVSDYVEILPNVKIVVTTEHFWSQGLYAFYDSNKTFISGKSANAGGTITKLEREVVKAPANAAYIVIGFLYQSSFKEAFLFQGVSQSILPTKRWYGLKWTTLGDSLTAYNDKTSMNYADYIKLRTGITVYNMGVSGTGYAAGGDQYNFLAKALLVPTDSDVVTIFGSGNDSGTQLQLGEASDTGTSTLAGCINTTIDNLRSIIPVVQLGIITPTPWVNNLPYDESQWMEDYSNLIVEICKRRSIACLDLYHCSNLDPNIEEVREIAYSKDNGSGVHPNEYGHKIIASRIQAFLDSLILH